MRAVVLAAGDGGRLAHASALPKPLVPLHGRPLIDYTLDALASTDIHDVLVVTGYRADEVRAGVEAAAPSGIDLEFVSNPRFEDGASYSLRAARESASGEPFLLTMADHLLSADLLARLLDAAGDDPPSSYVGADFGLRDPAYVDEATKLAVSAGGRVVTIGKELPVWSALDTGAFIVAPNAWPVIDAAPEDCELSTIFSALARRGELYAADVTGGFWYDVDTADDLAAAGMLLGETGLEPPGAVPILH